MHRSQSSLSHFFFPRFTAGAAICALIGDNAGRIVLLVFVSLNVLWEVFLLIMEISYTATDLGSLDLWIGFAKAIGGIGVFWLYFTKSVVVAYYKQVSQPELKV